MLDIIAYRPPPGVWLGIDTAGDDSSPGYVCTPEKVAELRQADVRWVARYLRLDGKVPQGVTPGGEYGPGVPDGCYPLSIDESRWILEGGLGIVPVQFGAFGNAMTGAAYGRAAAKSCELLGFPDGIHVFADIEGSGPQRAGAEACINYLEAHARELVRAQKLGAVYLTGQVPLTARLLYGLRNVSAYWSAAGPVPANPLPRGYCIEQDPPTKDYPDDLPIRLGDKRVAGLLCDTDTMRPDRFGRCPSIVATPDIAAAWHGEAMGRLSASMVAAVGAC